MSRHALLLLLLAGCASTPPGTMTVPTTTTVSMGGGERGVPGTMTLSTYSEVGGAAVMVSAPVERVWEVLPQVYKELGIEVETLDEPNRQIGNRQLTLVRRLGNQPLSTYLDCGNSGVGMPMANSYRINLSVLTTATPVQDGTEMRTTVAATASSLTASGAPVACGSRGRLEEAIAKGVQARVAG